VIDAHLHDQEGELLLHLLLGDVVRFCVEAFARGDDDVVRRCLGYVDLALQEGDSDVENAICVSFVENVGPWLPEMQAFIDTWPRALRDEAERQTGGR